MENKTLVQELTKEGLLGEELGRKTLQEASLGKRDVEELIYERRLVDEEKVAKVKSQVLKIPYKKVNAEEIGEELLKLVPEETVRNYKVIPISKSTDILVLGMINPDDGKAQDA